MFTGAPFVELEYLTSYEHMGVVDVTCVRGCTCNPTSINAANPDGVEQHSLGFAGRLELKGRSMCGGEVYS
eukprot:1126045-Prorocentrum_minimum.AAC.1